MENPRKKVSEMKKPEPTKAQGEQKPEPSPNPTEVSAAMPGEGPVQVGEIGVMAVIGRQTLDIAVLKEQLGQARMSNKVLANKITELNTEIAGLKEKLKSANEAEKPGAAKA